MCAKNINNNKLRTKSGTPPPRTTWSRDPTTLPAPGNHKDQTGASYIHPTTATLMTPQDAGQHPEQNLPHKLTSDIKGTLVEPVQCLMPMLAATRAASFFFLFRVFLPEQARSLENDKPIQTSAGLRNRNFLRNQGAPKNQ